MKRLLALALVVGVVASSMAQDSRTVSKAGTATALVQNVQIVGEPVAPLTPVATPTYTPTVVLVKVSAAVTVASEVLVSTPTAGKRIVWLWHTLSTDGTATAAVHFQATVTAGNSIDAVQAPAVGSAHDYPVDLRPTGPVSVGVYLNLSQATTCTLTCGYTEAP